MERLKTLSERATQHYRRSLLKWRGLYAFKKLLSLSRDKMQQAIVHHQRCLQRYVLACLCVVRLVTVRTSVCVVAVRAHVRRGHIRKRECVVAVRIRVRYGCV